MTERKSEPLSEEVLTRLFGPDHGKPARKGAWSPDQLHEAWACREAGHEHIDGRCIYCGELQED